MARIKQSVLHMLPLLAATFSLQAYAAGFSIGTQNVSGLGNAYAGAAAAAEDASTIFYNPAGMTEIKGSQVVGGVNFINTSLTFSNNGSTAATGQSLGSTGGDAGSFREIPHAYLLFDLTPTVKAGLGIGAPFGNGTQWSKDWIGRFQGTKSELQTVNVNPSLAYKPSENLSLGFGANYQRGEAEFVQQVNGVLVGGVGAEGETTFRLKGEQWGWNAGAMYKLSEATRLGVAYRSAIFYKMTGTAITTSTNAAVNSSTAFPEGNTRLNLTMPESLSFAGKHRLTDRWELLADATLTAWSRMESLTPINASTGVAFTSVNYKWKDSWRYGVGANYAYTDKTKLKIGVAFDQGVTSSEYRTVTLPDSDRIWLSFGVKQTLSKASVLDVGYTHQFIQQANLSNNNGSTATYGFVNGAADRSIDIFGVQYTYSF